MTLLPKAKQNKGEKKAFLLCTSQALSTHHCFIVCPLFIRVMWSCLVLLIPTPARGQSILHPYNFSFSRTPNSQLKSSMQWLEWKQEMGFLCSVLAKCPQDCQVGFYWSVQGAVVMESWVIWLMRAIPAKTLSNSFLRNSNGMRSRVITTHYKPHHKESMFLRIIKLTLRTERMC